MKSEFNSSNNKGKNSNTLTWTTTFLLSRGMLHDTMCVVENYLFMENKFSLAV